MSDSARCRNHNIFSEMYISLRKKSRQLERSCFVIHELMLTISIYMRLSDVTDVTVIKRRHAGGILKLYEQMLSSNAENLTILIPILFVDRAGTFTAA